jgi:hypothetical protein
MSVQLPTQVILANTTNNPGSITLPPANQIQGRVITFKDSGGNFATKALTLVCAGADTFEDGTLSKVLKETYGTIQLVASAGKWYVISGTQVNTLYASTINTPAISTISLSTSSVLLSSINFSNQGTSTASLYQSSGLLYYNNFVLAGSKVAAGQILFR